MPDYRTIQDNILRHISPAASEMDAFTALLRVRQVPARTFLLRAGEICQSLYFVQSGALRAFYSGPKDKESTIMFAMPDWWITDMYCFLNVKPAMMHIEAIADSTVFQLGKNEFESLLQKMPCFERYFRILMQNAYTREQLRMIETLSLPALERYERFLEKYPAVARQVTQKQLASWLGVSPEFLSSAKGKKNGGT